MIEINNQIVELEGLNILCDRYPSLKKLNITISKGDVNTISKKENNVIVTAIEKVYVFRMLSLAINREDDFEVKETPTSNKLTYYTDCSRNAVPNLEYYKDLVLTLATLGYNALSLYTEDTIEVDDEPYFGYMRGRLTKEEIKEMVRYGKIFGIELIPGVATLAHLDNIFFWSEYEQILDNVDVIMMQDERTYKLFDNLFKTLSECFESRRVHIGFDEAHRACLGRFYEKHGAVNRTEVILEHLKKILEIAAKYGFTCSLWSDMFFRLQYGKYYINDKETPKFSKEITDLIPRDVELIYWDYYHSTIDWYDEMIERHSELGDDIAFAGGAWNWLGYSPMNRRAFIHSKEALKSCKAHKVEKMYITAWGDNGSECARDAILPSLVLYAESYNNGSVDDEIISRRLVQLTKLSLDDFYVLDSLNEFKDNFGCQKALSNPAKWVVYNDPICGIFDYHLNNEYVEYFKKCLERISVVAKKDSPYQYIFKTNEALAKFMIEKAMIGNNLQKAYKENNKKALRKAALFTLPKILKLLNKFTKLLREQWYKENKTFGFDVLEIRLGGQKERIKETIIRIKEYLHGKIIKIDELELTRLSQKYPWEEDLVYKHEYKRISSPTMIP